MFFFNNCGEFYPRDKTVQASSVDGKSYPWPNSTTSQSSSLSRVTPVAFGDVDSNHQKEAVFLSSDPFGEDILVRIVKEKSFEEVQNVSVHEEPPSLKSPLLLFDMDRNNEALELFYVSEDQKRLVAVDLTKDPGAIRQTWNLVESVDTLSHYSMKVLRMAHAMGIEVGPNLLIFSVGGKSQMVSGIASEDGGWSDWFEWHEFPNGTTCSKTCGNGIEVRNRYCNNPEPRNGGAYCPPSLIDGVDNISNVQMKTCRLRDCDPSECGENEIFDRGSCEPDPSAPLPDPFIPGGGDGGSSGGVPGPDDCKRNEVWDPAFFRCFKAYTYTNITLHYQEIRAIQEDRETRTEYIDHRYRLSLNHSAAIGLSARDTAREYCVHRGQSDVVNYEIGEYSATSSSGLEGTRVFILCNVATNGYFHQGYYSQCPVGNIRVSFGFRGWAHDVGENVKYLKSVTCRDRASLDGASPTSSNSPTSPQQ